MKRIFYIIAAALLVLIATNPGIKEFESYEKGTAFKAMEGGRIHNYFICSVYKSSNADYRKKYFAILGNFYETGVDKLYKPYKQELFQ